MSFLLGIEPRERAFVGFAREPARQQVVARVPVGNVDDVPGEDELHDRFARFPTLPEPEPFVPAPAFAPKTLVEERDTNQSHLRMLYRPTVEVRDMRARAALGVYSTLLGGSMSSRLFEEIREQRGLAYSIGSERLSFEDTGSMSVGKGMAKSALTAANSAYPPWTE